MGGGIHTYTNLWINHILEREWEKVVEGRQRQMHIHLSGPPTPTTQCCLLVETGADKLLFLSTEWICFRNYVLTLRGGRGPTRPESVISGES